jgi:hypothetical protein
MFMLGQAVSWLKYTGYPKASVRQMGRCWPESGAVPLERRREDSRTASGGTVGAGFAARHAMPSA